MPDPEEQQANTEQPIPPVNEANPHLAEFSSAVSSTVVASPSLASQSMSTLGIPALSESFGTFDMPEASVPVTFYVSPSTQQVQYAPAPFPTPGLAPYPALPTNTLYAPVDGQIPYPATPTPAYAYMPGQSLPFMPYPAVQAPKVKASIYFPLTRKAPVHMQIFSMLFCSLFMALSIMGVLLYLIKASHMTGSPFTNPDSSPNGLAILLTIVLVLLIIPSCTLLSGALFGSWRGLLVSLVSIGGGILITHLSNDQFWAAPEFKTYLPFIGLPVASLVVGLIYDFRKYAAWWKSMLTLMLGAAIISIWFMASILSMSTSSSALTTSAASSANPAASMVGYWIGTGCFSLIGILVLTFPIAGIEGLIHWRIAVEKKQ